MTKAFHSFISFDSFYFAFNKKQQQYTETH